MGAGLLATLLIEVWIWHGGLLRLSIPLARDEGLPLPLLYWGIVTLYVWSYGQAFGLPATEQWARALRLGFSLHILALFAHLVYSLIREPPAGLAMWYLRYCQAVWAIILGGGVGVSWRLVAQWRLKRTADPFLFYLPLLAGVGIFVGFSWMLAPGLTLGAVVIGSMVLLGKQVHSLHAVGVRRGALMQRERGFLVITGLAALAFRMFYTLRVMSNPDFLNTGSDGPTYDALAWALVRREPLPEWIPWWAFHWFSPGYVRFLALMYWFVGRNYLVVCAVQSVIGVWACLLIYAVAKRLFDPVTARIATLFSAVNFSMIFAAASIGHQALDLFWTLAVMWCLVRYVETPHRWGRWMIGIGLLLGWAAVTREGNTAFWLFLSGWFLLGIRTIVGWRTSLIHFVALSLGVVVVLIPIIWGSGSGLWERLELQWFYERYTTTHMNAWFNPWRDPTAAWVLLREQPWTVVAKLTEALVANFNAIFLNQGYGLFDPVFLLRWSPYYYGMWTYAYLLACVGLAVVTWQALRTPREHLGWWLFLGLLLSRTLLHLFFQAAYRHRTSLEPFLIMLAAYGVRRLLLIGHPGSAQAA